MFRHLTLISVIALVAIAQPAQARNPIRNAFFGVYPGALETQLDTLPSDSNHCGVCHFDFSGGGTRNLYGAAVEAGINSGLSNTDAILAIEAGDSDGDGFSNLLEITDTSTFLNTPTFPGLLDANVGSTSSIPLGEITPFLTPFGSSDTTPPVVTVLDPNGGENVFAVGFYTIQYTATDSAGVSAVNLYLSDDSGSTFAFIGKNEAPTGSFSWFVPNMPGAANRIRVEAVDLSGNIGSDDSDTDFTITSLQTGRVATTLRDMKIPGTQPFEGADLEDPSNCRACHGDYDFDNEPFNTWQGSMMAQAMRDPLFLACLVIAEQDAPSVGDLCIRCHSPGGWQAGRSVDTTGGLLNPTDLEGVQCDFCHRMVDWDYQPGVSPAEDVDVLAGLSTPPTEYSNGSFINDPAAIRRGPFDATLAPHAFLESPFFREGDLCGTCHDVSNPVYVRTGTYDYELNPLDQEHPDMLTHNMFPVERTFSEWKNSEYASTGVFAPQFAGNKADGIVGSCQDCHMKDVNAEGCNLGVPARPDMPMHDLTGGNTFIPDILPSMYPGEVDSLTMAYAKQRATAMLQLAATVTATPEPFGLSVHVQNDTGHKLPSGYPEGRRIWLNIRAVDASGAAVFESGAYDPGTAVLTHDDQLKIYEVEPGLSPAIAAALSLPPGPSFHFVLSDTIYSDNRIPPRGFTNAAFEQIQSAPVAYTYADGQYWDDSSYFLPASAETAHVTLFYQTTTKEYVEFLRDENTTNSIGLDLYNAWAAFGKSTPVAMNELTIPLDEITTDLPEVVASLEPLHLGKPRPNPSREATSVELGLPRRDVVEANVFDLAGRRVQTLQDGWLEAGRHELVWDGRDQVGRVTPAGVYFLELRTSDRVFHRKIVRLR